MNVLICILILVVLFVVWYLANAISYRAFSRFIKKKYNRDI